jgi:hypothetical protein
MNKYVNIELKLLELKKKGKRLDSKLMELEDENIRITGNMDKIENRIKEGYKENGILSLDLIELNNLKELRNENMRKLGLEFREYKIVIEKLENFVKITNTFNQLKDLYNKEKDKYLELEGWELRIHHMGRTALGSTSYKDKVISFSKRTLLYDTFDTNKETLFHEIAHVLAPGDGHGKKWREKCLITGANPRALCCNSLIENPWILKCKIGCFRKEYNRRNYKWIKPQYSCPTCRGSLSYVRNKNFKDINQ